MYDTTDTIKTIKTRKDYRTVAQQFGWSVITKQNVTMAFGFVDEADALDFIKNSFGGYYNQCKTSGPNVSLDENLVGTSITYKPEWKDEDDDNFTTVVREDNGDRLLVACLDALSCFNATAVIKRDMIQSAQLFNEKSMA